MYCIVGNVMTNLTPKVIEEVNHEFLGNHRGYYTLYLFEALQIIEEILLNNHFMSGSVILNYDFLKKFFNKTVFKIIIS